MLVCLWPLADRPEQPHDGLSQVEQPANAFCALVHAAVEVQAHKEGAGMGPGRILERDELRPGPQSHKLRAVGLEEVHQVLQLLPPPRQPPHKHVWGGGHEVELQVVAVAIEEASGRVEVAPVGLSPSLVPRVGVVAEGPGYLHVLHHLVATPQLLVYELGSCLRQVRCSGDDALHRQHHGHVRLTWRDALAGFRQSRVRRGKSQGVGGGTTAEPGHGLPPVPTAEDLEETGRELRQLQLRV
mmetsp:Transcript_82322/g.259763  ORF Transcript_82322/g.259763 Transcript_82322/m.259763 type:complete len:242 (-) Transcript_82322:503-1228(-)